MDGRAVSLRLIPPTYLTPADRRGFIVFGLWGPYALVLDPPPAAPRREARVRHDDWGATA